MVIRSEVIECVEIAEAKAKFSELLKRAEAGEEIVVTRHGKPVATIAAHADATPKKKLRGAMKGKIWIAPDFDVLGPEWDKYLLVSNLRYLLHTHILLWDLANDPSYSNSHKEPDIAGRRT